MLLKLPHTLLRVLWKFCVLAISIFFLNCLVSNSVYASPLAETKVVSDDLEILVLVHPADGENLLLWIAPSFGFKQGHSDMAQLLSQQGFEVWLADINEALFLPHNSTAMREVDPKYVSDLIALAHAQTGKKIVLVSGSYGAIPVLRGARQWQLTEPANRYLMGAVLFSPNVYHAVPTLGVEPEFLPIAYASNIPVAIFQGEKNSNRWQVEKLADALRSGGSVVQVKIIPDVVSLFYGEERKPHIEAYFHRFASGMKTLATWFSSQPYTLEARNIANAKSSIGSGMDSRLKPFKGDFRPHPIDLKEISGRTYKINDFKNRITVINFWATWCTPCIKEIPSLNKLRQNMQNKSFELISVNYAENAETIKEFMKMVDVEFPVLLDEKGLESAKWKVIAFPSTFVIGRDGLIHYGINAGMEWDTPEVLEIIEQMLEQ